MSDLPSSNSPEARQELDPFGIADGRELMEGGTSIPNSEIFSNEAMKSFAKEADRLRYLGRIADPTYRLGNSLIRRIIDRIKYSL